MFLVSPSTRRAKISLQTRPLFIYLFHWWFKCHHHWSSVSTCNKEKEKRKKKLINISPKKGPRLLSQIFHFHCRNFPEFSKRCWFQATFFSNYLFILAKLPIVNDKLFVLQTISMLNKFGYKQLFSSQDLNKHEEMDGFIKNLINDNPTLRFDNHNHFHLPTPSLFPHYQIN